MVEATVPGKELVLIELKSPLILGVIAVVIILTLARLAGIRFLERVRFTPGAGRTLRLITLIVIVIALLVPIIVAFGTIDPKYDYGVWMEDNSLIVRFYRHESITINVCDIKRVDLLKTNDALDSLKYRVNGLSDPATGLIIGYFKTNDGKDSAVIVMSKHADKTLVILTDDNKVILVGVPGVERVYAELVKGLEACD